MTPKELTIIESDLGGRYADGTDCAIARALKRAGVPVDHDDGYYVAGWGRVTRGWDSETVGYYVWDDGSTFCSTTLRTGKLVFKEEE